SSVVSIVEDNLIEMMRRQYYPNINQEYFPISSKVPDYRAKRITDYLNLLQKIVQKQLDKLKSSAFEAGSEIVKYFELLPDSSPLKKCYLQMANCSVATEKARLQSYLRSQIIAGSIDVNIMTKVDRDTFDSNKQRIPNGSDAVAALRGFANSDLYNSGVVFSAGLNPRLYNYLGECGAFSMDENGQFKKRIIIKV